MSEIFPVDMVGTHKAPVSLYDYGKLFAARAAVALRSSECSLQTARLGPSCGTFGKSADDSHHVHPIWKRQQQEQ
jgi:hypothetical protein